MTSDEANRLIADFIDLTTIVMNLPLVHPAYETTRSEALAIIQNLRSWASSDANPH